MKVCLKTNEGIVLLKSGNTEEEDLLQKIVLKEKLGKELPYKGRSGAQPEDPPSERLVLRFLLTSGENFLLSASSDEDETSVRLIRDSIFYGGNGLIFLGTEMSNGKLSVIFTISYCGICNNPIIKMGECEHRVCDACADKCEHEYKFGPVHGGKFGAIGTGKFCKKCGKVKPEADRLKRKNLQQNAIRTLKGHWALLFCMITCPLV